LLPVIPEAEASAEAIRDLHQRIERPQIPESLDCISASGMTGENIEASSKP
jgi:hypothetical protein